MKLEWLPIFLLSCLCSYQASASNSGLPASHSSCPLVCNCTRVKSGYFKVKCNNKIVSLFSLDFESVAPAVTHLDLSKNLIRDVGSRAFVNFTSLKKLDLSYNLISSLADSTFEGLVNLDVLKLNHNNLTKIVKEAFQGLSNLKKLDISDNSLHCDCNQLWIIEWIRNASIKLSPMPKCFSPSHLKGIPLSQFYENGSCNLHEHSLDVLTMFPQQNQVVFEGDKLKLHCHTSYVGLDNPSIQWFWGKQDPVATFQDVLIERQNVTNTSFLSSLAINHLAQNHSGQWNCLLLSGQTNHSRTVSVVVISQDTQYCPQTVTRDNRGFYTWPRTVVGFLAELPCEVTSRDSSAMASQECGKDGKWHSLNVSACPFSSETTRNLQDFSRMNLTEEHGPAILESAQRLRSLSAGPPSMSDKMDAVFLSRAIGNYLRFLEKEKELGSLIIDMISFVMQLPRSALRAAQEEDQSCTKLVHALEFVVENTSSLQSPRSNLAVEEFRVTHESFVGITCVWYSVTPDDSNLERSSTPASRIFHCSFGNNTALLSNKEKVMEASVQVPASLFYQLETQGMPVLPTHQLLIAMYENSHLFPRSESNDTNFRWDVASCVIGTKLVGMKVQNLTDPLYVVVRAPTVREAGGWARPVWWDEDMNEGAGGWSQQGCVLSHLMHGMLVFRCDRFGYFGLLQEVPYRFQQRHPRDLSSLSHPAIYAGSIILVISLLVAIVTYVAVGPNIQMPKRAKHAVINTWIGISLLCFVFSVGIHQTDDVELCQAIGLVLHYLTLSTLLWMAITVSNMRKRVRKRLPLDLGSEDDLPPSISYPKPLVSLYLVGWGVGLMVVGVSGAVNLKQYSYFVEDEYCFLAPSPALGAVVVPCAAVIVYLLVCVLLVRCDIAQRHGETNAQLSDGTQGTENVDLELLDCAVPVHPEMGSVSVASAGSGSSSELEDAEHSPATQLRAVLIVLLLFMSLWAAAALSTATQLHSLLPHAEFIFGLLYALTATLLSAFILFFHCFARSDVRPCWQGVRCRSRTVSDTHAVPAPVPVPLPQPQQPLPLTVPVPSGSAKSVTEVKLSNTNVGLVMPVPVSVSNHMSSSTSINSNKSRHLEAAAELNKTAENGPPCQLLSENKVSNMHLMPIYQPYPSVADPEVFYNARQSDMARKFFRKQRRQAAFQHNQLGSRRRGDGGGDQSDLENSLRDSLRGSRSKVSNTNIHVEEPGDDLTANLPCNRNILTEISGEPVPIERWVIGADSPPQINNDGTFRVTTPDPLRSLESRPPHQRYREPTESPSASSRQSRGTATTTPNASGSFNNRRESKFKNDAVHNGTLSSMSSVKSKNWEAEAVPPVASPISCDTGSIVSGMETESDLPSTNRSYRRSSRSPRSRKRHRRAKLSAPAPSPSLASSALSIPSRDRDRDVRVQSHCNGAAAAPAPAPASDGDADNSTLSKMETCV